MKSIITNTLEETSQLANDFVKNDISGGMVVCLEGDLGSGKTTFTQGILKALGAEGPYTSPTFVIMKEYDIDKQTIKKVYHIDAYRIGGDDMLSLGWNDIISDEHALVIIEWPEKIKDILPQNSYMISCEGISELERKYIFKN